MIESHVPLLSNFDIKTLNSRQIKGLKGELYIGEPVLRNRNGVLMTSKKLYQAVAKKLPVRMTNNHADSVTDKSRGDVNSLSFSLLYFTSKPLSQLRKWWRLCLYLPTVNLIWLPAEKTKEGFSADDGHERQQRAASEAAASALGWLISTTHSTYL